MNKENDAVHNLGEPNVRITRARAKALGTSGKHIQKPPRPEPGRVLRAKSKRMASDENKSAVPPASLQNKRRATLADVTNVLCDRSYFNCSTGGKFQRNKPEVKVPTRRNIKVTPCAGMLRNQEDVKDKVTDDISKLTVASRVIASAIKEKPISDASKSTEQPHPCITLEENIPAPSIASNTNEVCMVLPNVANPPKEDDKDKEMAGTSKSSSIVDIDKQKDPLMCGLYAAEIYEHKRVTELNTRPSIDYMEKVQRDITPSMRGILVDWLVEVSEEYKLVPDTLYLTVNLIDRFLSGNYVEKQRLQLLGVTCMLIASKYEEMCAPQVEEFCYITANTYGKEEVLKMERKVLNCLCFQLSVPTTKTFLRRYVHAAQSTYKVPLVDLELLANYLAELTLVEYSFLTFLPSLIAASAVFLARWMLNQSVHPWNLTLEHYTRYKIEDLKVTVVAMQDLQLNNAGSQLNAIREKYRHQKFNSVANLSSPKSVQTLF